jgi:hypothetical protein
MRQYYLDELSPNFLPTAIKSLSYYDEYVGKRGLVCYSFIKMNATHLSKRYSFKIPCILLNNKIK